MSKKNINKVHKQDKSPKVFQRSKVDFDFNLIEPNWTEKQRIIINLILDKKTKMIIIDGCAGTGKTILALFCLLELIKQKRLSGITYVRSLIQAVDGETGYLAGDLGEKVEPFMAPLWDKMIELINDNAAVDRLVKENRVQTIPTSMLRGRQFNVEGLYLDEAQNCHLDSLTTVATRVGPHSKLIISGDSMGQNDFGKKSGFKEFIKIFNDDESQQNGVFYVKLTSEDVVRGELVKFIVGKIERYLQNKD